MHLTRDREATIKSFAKRHDRGIMKAYQHPGILMRLSTAADPVEVATDYVDTVTQNIRMFLRDKPLQMAFPLERASHLFSEFCSRIGAEVDMPAALGEFSVKHNASE